MALYVLPVGLEHLQSGIEFTGPVSFEKDGPTTFKVWSLQPFLGIWTVITDCGHTETRRLHAVEDVWFEPSATPMTMGLIREQVERNYRLRENPCNGILVLGRTDETIYLRLTNQNGLAEHCSSGCTCPYCSAHPSESPKWDTLCVPIKQPEKGNDFAYTVHMPEPFETIPKLQKLRKRLKQPLF